uniref:Uncharacterized protein n=1 Tax=viral metagenome TaxID=1070528 RepID=A0A6C0HG08_9ZZZZ
MYSTMEINILGQKMRVEIIILCMIIGGFIGVNMFCSCAGGVKEGFYAAEDLMGAALNYSMGNGVKSSWENAPAKKAAKHGNVYDTLDTNVGGEVPLPDGELYMFYNNKNSPDCCPSTYSGDNGCVCVSREQMVYLNQRGGNRTLDTEY